MEVSLKKAGFSVSVAANGKQAIEMADISPPDLLLADTSLPGLDGFELCRWMKGNERFKQIPIVFLTQEKGMEFKVKGLELGAEDYLTKPIYIREVVIRVRMILQRVEKERFERRDGKGGFGGSLADIGLVDLVQTFEIGRKTGIIQLDGPRSGVVFFRDGKVVGAESGRASGEGAFYRLLNSSEGTFEVRFVPVEREDCLGLSTQALLLEGIRRIDECSRIMDQLPPFDTVFELDPNGLGHRLSEIPDHVNGLLRLFDGMRTLKQVLEESELDDLEASALLSGLFADGLLHQVGSGWAAASPLAEDWLNPPLPAHAPAPHIAPPRVLRSDPPIPLEQVASPDPLVPGLLPPAAAVPSARVASQGSETDGPAAPRPVEIIIFPPKHRKDEQPGPAAVVPEEPLESAPAPTELNRAQDPLIAAAADPELRSLFHSADLPPLPVAGPRPVVEQAPQPTVVNPASVLPPAAGDRKNQEEEETAELPQIKPAVRRSGVWLAVAASVAFILGLLSLLSGG
jgi:CheY-like chemotaxis protein